MLKEYIESQLEINKETLRALEEKYREIKEQIDCEQGLISELQKDQDLSWTIFSPRSLQNENMEKIQAVHKRIEELQREQAEIETQIGEERRKTEEFATMLWEADRSSMRSQAACTTENQCEELTEDTFSGISIALVPSEEATSIREDEKMVSDEAKARPDSEEGALEAVKDSIISSDNMGSEKSKGKTEDTETVTVSLGAVNLEAAGNMIDSERKKFTEPDCPENSDTMKWINVSKENSLKTEKVPGAYNKKEYAENMTMPQGGIFEETDTAAEPDMAEPESAVESGEMEATESRAASTLKGPESETAEENVSESEVPESETAETNTSELAIAEADTLETAAAEGSTAESEVPESETAETNTSELAIAEADTLETAAEGSTAESEVPESETAETNTSELAIAEVDTPETAEAEGSTAGSEVPESETAETNTLTSEVPSQHDPVSLLSEAVRRRASEFAKRAETEKQKRELRDGLAELYQKTELCLALLNGNRNRCKSELREMKSLIRELAEKTK